MQEHHQSSEPVCTPDEFCEMKTLPASDGSIPEGYAKVEEALSSATDYQPVCLNDFAPGDSYHRKQWLSKLVLPFSVRMYRYAHGNKLGTVSFVWKIPTQEPEDESVLARVLLQLSRQQRIYATMK